MRLFRDSPAQEADVRPTLLGVVTLLFLLLFFLMSTSSGQRLGVVDLRFAAAGEAPPLPHSGLVKQVRVALDREAVVLEFDVATTDVAAAATTTELRRLVVPGVGGALDLSGLAVVIEQVHAIDGSQREAELTVGAEVPAATLMAALDVIRGPAASPRFPDVSLR